MRIGVLAQAAGVSVPTIRYYESIGLLTPPARQGGQRIYRHEDIKTLSLIRHCRDLDFSLDETRDILASVQRRLLCSDTKTFAEQHLRSIRTKIAALRALEATVATLVSNCETTCCGSAAPDCVILQAGGINCGS
jgi:DNA-binding transcriptional MerR regulator